jgi:eukaryotic-like serine/threonine-protein kinase
MTALDASGLVDALADERLLEPEQFEEFVATMLPRCREVAILAQELVFRGWLTPYQIERVVSGQAASLVLGSYVLLEPLGEGANGRVYRARNWKLDRIVAIKIIRDAKSREPAVIARFRREIRALGRIRHPHIVLAVDADFHSGVIWYAMEYVKGCDLGRFVRRNGPLSVPDACNYVVQAAGALRHAHEFGLIHRDIKPSNLLLTEPDRVVKLLDMGLTRCDVPLDDSVFAALTHSGALIGTPDYMPPEQVKDSRSADVRSDLYSLGCTFYYLLTGLAPFEHIEGVVDKLLCQCESEPIPLEQLRPDLPGGVGAIVRKLMNKRRRDRFQSPAQLMAALTALSFDRPQSLRDADTNAPALTLVDVPAASPSIGDAPATEVMTRAQLGLIGRANEAELVEEANTRRTFSSLNPAQIVLAVCIATAVLLALLQWGIGPDPLRHDSERTGLGPITQPQDPPPDDTESPAEIKMRPATLRKATRVNVIEPDDEDELLGRFVPPGDDDES